MVMLGANRNPRLREDSWRDAEKGRGRKTLAKLENTCRKYILAWELGGHIGYQDGCFVFFFRSYIPKT